MYNLQDPEITRTERFGSRAGPIYPERNYKMRKNILEFFDDEYSRDFDEQAFCGRADLSK